MDCYPPTTNRTPAKKAPSGLLFFQSPMWVSLLDFSFKMFQIKEMAESSGCIQERLGGAE